MIEQLLERLSEMFPRQHYQSSLEQYLAEKSIKTGADVEYWAREYENNHSGRLK